MHLKYTWKYTLFLETLLYGDSSYDDTKNTLIMNATMEFLFTSKRFDVPLV